MKITALLFTLVLFSLLTASAQTPSSTPSSKLTGCLKGKTDQYYLVDKNGHRHTLMSSQDLSSFVDHEVTITGKQGRDAGTSHDAEGHKTGFFRVENVSDEGTCKKK